MSLSLYQREAFSFLLISYKGMKLQCGHFLAK